MLDVLAHLDLICHSKESQTHVSPRSDSIDTDSLEQSIHRSTTFALRKLRSSKEDMIDLSHRNPFVAVSASEPLTDVVVVLAGGVHRLLVVHPDNPHQVVGMITQSDIISYLALNPSFTLGDAATKTPKDLESTLLSRTVHSVEESTRTLDAFLRMHQQGISGLAVLDAQGVLVGNLSASDLKTLEASYRFSDLQEPLSVFLPRVRKEEGKPAHRSLWVVATTPLHILVERVVEQRVHRVYVVDDNKKPIGIITLTDLLRLAVTGIQP